MFVEGDMASVKMAMSSANLQSTVLTGQHWYTELNSHSDYSPSLEKEFFLCIREVMQVVN